VLVRDIPLVGGGSMSFVRMSVTNGRLSMRCVGVVSVHVSERICMGLRSVRRAESGSKADLAIMSKFLVVSADTSSIMGPITFFLFLISEG
jgi:hypothetical protein